MPSPRWGERIHRLACILAGIILLLVLLQAFSGRLNDLFLMLVGLITAVFIWGLGRLARRLLAGY